MFVGLDSFRYYYDIPLGYQIIDIYGIVSNETIKFNCVGTARRIGVYNMKFLKKPKKKHSSLIIILVVVLLLEVAVLAWLLKNTYIENDLEDSPPTHVEPLETIVNSVPSVSAVPTEAETEPEEIQIEPPVIRDYKVMELINGQIQTPYCTLSYPEGLADLLLVINTSQQPYTLEFYAVMEEKPELRLFDISLGEGSGGNMGKTTTPEGEVPLNVTIYTLTMDEDWTEGEISTAYAMQDVVNDMIEQMAPKNDSAQSEVPVFAEQPAEEASIHNMEIITPYCTMYYPARWSNTMYYDHDDSREDIYKVHIYGRISGSDSQLLFSIYFGGDEGEQLGAVMDSEGKPVPVNLLLNQLELDGLNEDDAALLCAMQEASNQLIERLPLLP